MSKIAIKVVIFCTLLLFSNLIQPITSNSESAINTRGVSVRVCPSDNTNSHKLGPKLLVLVSNGSQSPIYIDRHLSGVPMRQHNSLWVKIKDARSGKEIGPRATFKRIQRIWRESDFIELERNLNYGPIIDLRDYFQIEKGKAYSCRFVYRSIAPKKVGKLQPWDGTAMSRPIKIYL